MEAHTSILAFQKQRGKQISVSFEAMQGPRAIEEPIQNNNTDRNSFLEAGLFCLFDFLFQTNQEQARD